MSLPIVARRAEKMFRENAWGQNSAKFDS